MNHPNPATGTETLTVTRDGHVAIVTLNRPEALNAIDRDLHHAIPQVLMALSEDRDVRAIVLTGAGRAFSAGGGLKAVAARFCTDAGRDHPMNVPGVARLFRPAKFQVATPVRSTVYVQLWPCAR